MPCRHKPNFSSSLQNTSLLILEITFEAFTCGSLLPVPAGGRESLHKSWSLWRFCIFSRLQHWISFFSLELMPQQLHLDFQIHWVANHHYYFLLSNLPALLQQSSCLFQTKKSTWQKKHCLKAEFCRWEKKKTKRKRWSHKWDSLSLRSAFFQLSLECKWFSACETVRISYKPGTCDSWTNLLDTLGGSSGYPCSSLRWSPTQQTSSEAFLLLEDSACRTEYWQGTD